MDEFYWFSLILLIAVAGGLLQEFLTRKKFLQKVPIVFLFAMLGCATYLASPLQGRIIVWIYPVLFCILVFLSIFTMACVELLSPSLVRNQ